MNKGELLKHHKAKVTAEMDGRTKAEGILYVDEDTRVSFLSNNIDYNGGYDSREGYRYNWCVHLPYEFSDNVDSCKIELIETTLPKKLSASMTVDELKEYVGKKVRVMDNYHNLDGILTQDSDESYFMINHNNIKDSKYHEGIGSKLPDYKYTYAMSRNNQVVNTRFDSIELLEDTNRLHSETTTKDEVVKLHGKKVKLNNVTEGIISVEGDDVYFLSNDADFSGISAKALKGYSYSRRLYYRNGGGTYDTIDILPDTEEANARQEPTSIFKSNVATKGDIMKLEGKKVSIERDNGNKGEGIIAYNDNEVYFLSNDPLFSGQVCSDMQGYKYSWILYNLTYKTYDICWANYQRIEVLDHDATISADTTVPEFNAPSEGLKGASPSFLYVDEAASITDEQIVWIKKSMKKEAEAATEDTITDKQLSEAGDKVTETILNTINPKQPMNKLDQLEMDKFFSTSKNVKAIKEMKDTLTTIPEALNIAEKEINNIKDKAIDLKCAFNSALNRDDHEELKGLLESNKPYIEFMNNFMKQTVELLGEKEVKEVSTTEFFKR